MKTLLLLGILALGASSLAFGQVVLPGGGAPEIDASQATTALALVSGGILVIRGRRKK